jgi:hypothetical protein
MITMICGDFQEQRKNMPIYMRSIGRAEDMSKNIR